VSAENRPYSVTAFVMLMSSSNAPPDVESLRAGV